MRKSNTTVALIIASGLFVGSVGHPFGRGAVLAADTKMEEMKKDAAKAKSIQERTVSEGEYIQHLRESRKHLSEAKDAFDADLPLRPDRKDILEPLDKAIDVIDNQIKAYEDGLKKK